MNNNRVEPVVFLLFVGMLVFTGILIFCEIRFPMDGQIFQVIAGLLTAFSGAFFMRVKPRGISDSTDADPSTTTVKKIADVHTETHITPTDPIVPKDPAPGA